MSKKVYVCLWSLFFLLLCSSIGLESRAEGEDKIYEVTERANLRKTPSVEGVWLMTLPEGALVTMIGGESGGYTLVQFEDVKGYVLTDVLRAVEADGEEEDAVAEDEEEEAAEEPEEESGASLQGHEERRRYAAVLAMNFSLPSKNSKAIVIVASTANFRKASTTDSACLCQIPAGEKLSFLDVGENGYYHVLYNDMEGYVYGDCLKADSLPAGIGNRKHARAEAPQVVVPQIAEEEGGAAIVMPEQKKERSAEAVFAEEDEARRRGGSRISYKIGSRTNMRTLPEEESKTIISLPAGAEVLILGKSGDYTMVQYDGLSGYVLEERLLSATDYARQSGAPILFSITAYCSCKKCCGNYSPEVRGGIAHTATGTVPEQGRTIAVDPSVIPYGSRVTIEGVGTFIAEDCGGGIRGNRIDMYFESHEDAVRWGRKLLYVTIQRP